jgi:hypothetical protein
MRKSILWFSAAVALLIPMLGTGCGSGKKSGEPKLVGPPDPTAQPIGNAPVKGDRQNAGGNKSLAQ